MNLLIATTNEHKLSEIQKLLSGIPVKFETLAGYPKLEEPEETGITFAENARLKATYYSIRTGKRSLAEDSGLEIDALDGAPGVLSSRYNGLSYPEKFSAIYTALSDRDMEGSTARFVSAVAVADGQRILFETCGIVEGEIAITPTGSGGFGYDPIFFYPPYTRTLAELSPREKRAISHRGKAFRTLREFLHSSER